MAKDPFDDPFFAQAKQEMAQSKQWENHISQGQEAGKQQEINQAFTEKPSTPQLPSVSKIDDILTSLAWLFIALPLVLTVIIGLIFGAGYKEAKFVTNAKNVLKAIWETLKYLIIPNEKGLKFVDKVIATPIMRLELFGLNQGFVKIGEIYNGYFEHGFRHKNHGVEENINPYLGHVAFVISAFQTKQYLLHAVRVLVSIELFYLFMSNIFTLPFLYLMQYFGTSMNIINENQGNLMLVAMSVLAVLSIVMAWSYLRKIVDDVLFIMQNQQDLNEAEFRNFILDNLSIIGRHGKAIDGQLAKDAEGYTLATFFDETKK